jgi:4-amino-4-deoxy-L-arabinose transferase-like glycosyltransferase
VTNSPDNKLSRVTIALLRCTRGDVLRALAVIALVCASFTAVASLVLVAYTRAHPELDFIDAPGGLWLRAGLFSALTCGAGVLLVRWRGVGVPLHAFVPRERLSRSAFAGLLGLLFAIVLLLGIRLGDYPFAAPDEVHHLIVARNLAEHGAYASGHPEAGFKYFDSFDSVGPVVLGPIAMAFKIFGTSLAVARGVMVLFFAGLCLATWGFTRGLFGPRAALASVLLLLGTYSSIYLGRTLYGEVPAYFFLLLGLLAWRRALDPSPERKNRTDQSDPTDQSEGSLAAPGHWKHYTSLWALLAGVLVGCAILAKTIIILVAFSFLGAWMHDRVTHRRIGWRQVFFPVIGGVVVLGCWSVFQGLHGTVVAETGGVLAIYQHYLLFGVTSVASAFTHAVLPHPMAHLAWLAVLMASVPVLFRHRHDPPAITLYLYAIFLLYWWFFFTPGHLHRYLWNAYAILAIFAAPWLLCAVETATRRNLTVPKRVLALVVVVMLAWPGLHWALFQAREIVSNDEMVPEYALIEAVTALPPATRIGTDVDRLPGLLNFFGDRVVETGPDPLALLGQFETVITRDSPSLRAALPPGCGVQPAGNFVLLSTPRTTE